MTKYVSGTTKHFVHVSSLQHSQRIAIFGMAAILALVVGACQRAPQGDPQCSNARRPLATYAHDAKSADEFLTRGDEAFDGGNCNQAIASYTQAIALNPNYAEAYNNRAYTYMRMQKYEPALQDLDQALRIRPDYIHALMNRGDIHNYYFAQDRKKAIADYDHILRLGGQSREPSVCGHRAVAIYSMPGHEGWNGVSWFKLLLTKDRCEMKET
jgi:tetratricopeptide (TPR) repeat protein